MQNRDSSVAAMPRARPSSSLGLTVAMVAVVGVCAGLASLAGCGQKGPLFLEGPEGAIRPAAISPRPIGIEGTDPLSSPATDVIPPPVVYPASPQPSPNRLPAPASGPAP